MKGGAKVPRRGREEGEEGGRKEEEGEGRGGGREMVHCTSSFN